MNGHDEGVELINAGAIKDLAGEIGLPLNTIKLSRDCPSRHTLAQGDTRLAAYVLISVAKDIQQNDAKLTPFIVDHSKRSGIKYCKDNHLGRSR
jgi:hypothetical protein